MLLVLLLIKLLNLFRSCIEFEPSYVKCEELFTSGRMSFKNFNPTVEVGQHIFEVQSRYVYDCVCNPKIDYHNELLILLG